MLSKTNKKSRLLESLVPKIQSEMVEIIGNSRSPPRCHLRSLRSIRKAQANSIPTKRNNVATWNEEIIILRPLNPAEENQFARFSNL
jgi:hypothetical protein